ncbi:MAG TPA: LytTR family transcriptional regulator, partial [Clostridiaceae bacterium]|nr:LytTR family transcriptional regulator [Clostridiaceae bacterium]
LIATPDRQSGISSRLRNDYEKMTRRMVERFSLADNRDYLNYCFSIKNLKNQLVDSEKYEFLGRGKNVDGEDIIYEIQFKIIDRSERILLCTARNVSRKCEVLNFRTNRSLKRLPFSSINFIESFGRKSLIVTAEEQLEANEMISSLDKRLPGREFMRCHRCYIVRLDAISEIVGNDAILNNGTVIPVSRNHLSDLRKKIANLERYTP